MKRPTSNQDKKASPPLTYTTMQVIWEEAPTSGQCQDPITSIYFQDMTEEGPAKGLAEKAERDHAEKAERDHAEKAERDHAEKAERVHGAENSVGQHEGTEKAERDHGAKNSVGQNKWGAYEMEMEGELRAYEREMMEIVRRHTNLSFMACYEAGCLIHRGAKDGAKYFPEDFAGGQKKSKGKCNHGGKKTQRKPKDDEEEVYW